MTTPQAPGPAAPTDTSSMEVEDFDELDAILDPSRMTSPLAPETVGD